MSIRRRLDRLERARGDGKSCGPGCPPCRYTEYRQDGPDGEPVVVKVEGSDQPCPRCGRAAEVAEMLLLVVRTREEVLALKAREMMQ